jgi:hypothetical protein
MSLNFSDVLFLLNSLLNNFHLPSFGGLLNIFI